MAASAEPPNLQMFVPTPRGDGEDYSLLTLVSVLLQHHVLVLLAMVAGLLTAAAVALVPKPEFRSTATFVPQGAESGMSGLALAASQFGVRVPTSSGAAWSTGIYVELLRSRALLEPILLDSLRTDAATAARTPVLDLLRVKPGPPALRLELGLRAIRELVVSSEDRKQGAVTLAVTSPWPEFSYAVSSRLIRGVNEFNLVSRQSQARAERQFVEMQANQALRSLREVEDSLQRFLQRNRTVTSSSQLEFERDRIQRDLSMRQQLYSTLEQNREEARIREVRDSPVITVLEAPHLPAAPESRHLLLKLAAGVGMGGVLGVLLALLLHSWTSLRAGRSKSAAEFNGLLHDSLPGLLRRDERSSSAATS